MKIEDLLKDKKVLLIPVYSSRSYKSGRYDLATDGNASKYLMKILKSNAKSYHILYPMNSVGVDKINNIILSNNKNVNWIPADYGANAKETRNMGEYFIKVVKNLFEVYHYDLIVTEVDTLAEIASENKYDYCNSNNLIYWAGTHTTFGTRWDTPGHNEINRKITKNVTTACLLPGQVDYYGGKTFYDKYEYDPSYTDKKIIFFPFRLSDKAYKLDLLKSAVDKLIDEGINNFVVVYTDPNESLLLDNEDSNVYVKVSPNKLVYLAILKGKPIIPFFDDMNKNSHSNIFEFLFYGCDVIMYSNQEFESVTKIDSDEEFYEILKKKVRA